MPVQEAHNLIDESEKYFVASKTLRTPSHRSTVFKFVRDQYPQCIFKRIYDASTDGWDATSFHKCCDRKGWTLTLLETTEDFIFGGFTTAEWRSSLIGINKPDPCSFMFNVNENSKYPITRGDR